MKNWIKKVLGIERLEQEIDGLKQEVDLTRVQVISVSEELDSKLAELKKYSRVDADVGYRQNNTIILTGVYKNRGYVQFYDLGNEEFERAVEELRHRGKSAIIRNIDSPHRDFIGSFEL